MGGDSSASASNRQGLGDIPLIWCTECGSGQVLRRISRKPWSAGHVFYCCPMYKQDGTGCPFWYWEEDYLDKLARMRACKETGAGSENRVRRTRMQGDWSNSGSMVVNKDADLVAIVKELVTFVKAMCLLLLCILFVLVLILVVQLIK
ncbi:unnamed protein product [Urochloa decumbens]|uniref:GRF-type domain-containing protein n=1 Tax=Urochloa decumbens TaxID=240449 RepID=A0ABC9C864_9POAL